MADHQNAFAQLVLRANPINGKNFCLEYLNGSDDFINDTTVLVQPSAWQVWVVGLTMVTIISFSAACGIILLPFITPSFYERTLTYFVALGIGTLSGSAVFNLIPEAFNLSAYIPDYLNKSCAVIFGIYLFYFVDKLINVISTMKEKSMIVPNMSKNSDKIINTELQSIDKTEIKSIRRSSVESKKSHIAPIAWLVIFGDGLHNFIDGLSIGASFNNSLLEGISVSIAILCEELPHELGDCAILISSGMSLKKALIYNLLSAFTCYIGFIIGVLVGNISPEFGPFVFAVAGGMFLYIALTGMLSEINEKAEELLKTNFKLGISTILLQSAGLATGLTIIYLLTRFGSLLQF